MQDRRKSFGEKRSAVTTCSGQKTTPFAPAGRQSPPPHPPGTPAPLKPRRHPHSRSTCESSSPLPSLLRREQRQPRGPPGTRSGCSVRAWPSRAGARHLHVPSRAATRDRAPVPPHRQPRLRPPRPGRAPRSPATWPARPARRRFLCPAPPSAGGGAWARASAAAWPMGARLTLASPPRGRQSRRAVVVILWSGVWMPPLPRAGAARRRGLPGYFGKGV